MATDETDYVTLTREYLERNRSLGRHTFQLGDLEFDVFEGVFSPHVFGDTAFFAREMVERAGSSFLEIGSGAGVVAVQVAMAGCEKVVATDLNPAAAANTSFNAERFGVESKLKVRCGDLFASLSAGERFEVIFWNPPFIPVPSCPGDSLESAVFDFAYEALRRYLVEGPGYLVDGGSLYFGFSSSSGDLEWLKEIANSVGMALRLCRSTEIPDDLHPGFYLELYEAVVVEPPRS